MWTGENINNQYKNLQYYQFLYKVSISGTKHFKTGCDKITIRESMQAVAGTQGTFM